jgi:hypothetical protein
MAWGARLRTGAGAAARIVYPDGTVGELGADTAFLLQRLERGPTGAQLLGIYQTLGTTVHHGPAVFDPAANVQIETPALSVAVRGAAPLVQVAPNGATRVINLAEEPGGTLVVQGTDPASTGLFLVARQETEAAPGHAPAPAVAVGRPPAGPAAPPAGGCPPRGSRPPRAPPPSHRSVVRPRRPR